MILQRSALLRLLSKFLLLTIGLSGWIEAQTPVTVSLVSTPTPAVYGSPITLVASVSPSNATGRIAFYDGASVLGIATLAGGQATLTTVLLPSGTRHLRAHYAGTSAYGKSDSVTVLQTVTPVGAGKLQTAATLTVGASPSAVAAGDLNGDGNIDLVVINQGSGNVSVLLGTGAGAFASAVNYPAGNSPTSVVLGDFNGDGNLDAAVSFSSASTVNLFLGKGDGTFQPVGAGIPVGASPMSLAAADFDGDGNIDLATANQAAGTVSVLLGNGDGTFQTARTLPAASGSIALTVADFNLDGHADLAVANNLANNISVFFGNGDGTFGAASQQSLQSLGLYSSNPTAILAADF